LKNLHLFKNGLGTNGAAKVCAKDSQDSVVPGDVGGFDCGHNLGIRIGGWTPILRLVRPKLGDEGGDLTSQVTPAIFLAVGGHGPERYHADDDKAGGRQRVKQLAKM
jgi:hypothetical protein